MFLILSISISIILSSCSLLSYFFFLPEEELKKEFGRVSYEYSLNLNYEDSIQRYATISCGRDCNSYFFFYLYHVEDEPEYINNKKLFTKRKNVTFEDEFLGYFNHYKKDFDNKYNIDFNKEYYYSVNPMIYYPDTKELLIFIFRESEVGDFKKIYKYNKMESCELSDAHFESIKNKTIISSDDVTYENLIDFYSNNEVIINPKKKIYYYYFKLDKELKNTLNYNVAGNHFCYEKNEEFENSINNLIEENINFFNIIAKEQYINFKKEYYYYNEFPMIYYPKEKVLIILKIYL